LELHNAQIFRAMSIGSASSHILRRDAEGVFDTVAQALVPAAPGLFPALGL
jgi:hypothetical protein